MSRFARDEIMLALPPGSSVVGAKAVAVGQRFGVQVTSKAIGVCGRTTKVYPPFVETMAAAQEVVTTLLVNRPVAGRNLR